MYNFELFHGRKDEYELVETIEYAKGPPAPNP
jgi:hypothetical protein